MPDITTAPVSQYKLYDSAVVGWLNSTGFEFDGFPLRAVYATPEKAFGHVQQILAETLPAAEAEKWKKQPRCAISVQRLGVTFDRSRYRGYNTYLRGSGSAAVTKTFTTRHPRPINLRYQIEAFFVYRKEANPFDEWLEGQQKGERVFLDIDFSTVWAGWAKKTVPLVLEGVTDNSDGEVGEESERLVRTTVSAVMQGWYFYPVEVRPVLHGIEVDFRLAPSGVDIQAASVEDVDEPPFELDSPDLVIDTNGKLTPK